MLKYVFVKLKTNLLPSETWPSEQSALRKTASHFHSNLLINANNTNIIEIYKYKK